ncbi:MAG: 3-isopropylmalate dehydrogenase [Bacteroidales bacterium]|nr:3-isopropylmalate dehydrogenase [Bacteroidales bacterium]
MEFNIAVLPGDGIGPEVINQALRLLKVIEKKEGVSFKLEKGLIGAVAIDETGNPLPDETIAICKRSDAVLMGAVGHPKYDMDPKAKVRPEQGLLKIRKTLGLFANIRPIATYDLLNQASPLKDHLVKGVDFVVYRELTGGIYFGEKGRRKNGTEAYDHCNYTAYEIRRIGEMAFEAALARRGKLTLVDKANVLETSRLWRETIQSMAGNYPGVKLDFMFVDAAAMRIIQNPASFDVVLTENMFGDILTDEASVITGSIGMLPSASVGSSTALFEPIHGSYPEGAGKNIANPFGTILSMGMMLGHLKLHGAESKIKGAVNAALEAGIVTSDINPQNNYSTSQVGDWLEDYLANNY